MAAPDGKVIISTRLDNSQIPKGVKEIKGSLGGLKSVVGSLGAAIAGAFSVMAIVKFATESVKAANQLADALTGLKSILDGQGRSFSDAQKFLEEYTADGLVPMANAITAYKNLASRGYDDTQIKQTLVALKDASAFGRQASYSMGEAVESATEGLKNENSVLVDNAGVTKNVAKMWEEYAASIGTTANNLTQQQKIQAEVNGILTESRFQAGDAAKVAGTLSGQLAQLSVNFTNLKVAVGNALKPIVQSFLPVINVAIATLTRFANAIASVVSVLFGNTVSGTVEATQAVADGYNSAADGAENLAKSTKEAGKAAKKYLAGFDELTKIGDSSSGGGASGAVATGGGATAQTTTTADTNLQDNISPKIQAIVDKIKQLIEPLKDIDFGPVVKAFGRLKEAISPLTTKLFEGLEWAWNNILVPLAEWTIEDALPVFLDLLSAALDVLNTAIDGLKPLAIWLWDKFLQPIAEWTGDLVIAALGVLTDMLTGLSDWISQNQSLVEDFIIVVGSFAAAWALVNGAIGIWNIAVGVWNGIGAVAAAVTTAFGAAVNFLLSPVTLIIAAIGALIAIVVLLVKHWDTVKEVAGKCWEGIVSIWESACTWFDETIIQPITKLFTDIWDSVTNGASEAWDGIKSAFSSVATWFGDIFGDAWEGVKNIFSVGGEIFAGIQDGILDAFKEIVNAIIEGINTVVAIPFDGINAALTTIKDISIVGYKPFDWISTIPVPQIPYLAKGAVLPANKPFLAMVGDQTHGTNVEAPLATIQEAVALVMDDYAASNLAGQEAILAVLKDILEAVLGIEIGDDVIGQAVARYNRKVAVMRGGA